MGLDGGCGDDKFLGDLSIGQAPSRQFGHLDLAGGELLGLAASHRAPLVHRSGDNSPGHLGSQQGMPVSDLTQTGDERLCVSILEHESAGPGVESIEEVVVPVEGGEDDDLDVAELADLRGGRDTIHDGHLDVHEDDVGSGFFHHLHALSPVGGLPNNRDVGLHREDEAEPLTN